MPSSLGVFLVLDLVLVPVAPPAAVAFAGGPPLPVGGVFLARPFGCM